VARTLNVIGNRWTVLILRDLILQGPRRFQDFENSLKGITPAVLTNRLQELKARGVIESRLYSKHPPRRVYELTAKGQELRPVLRAMKEWGQRYA